MQTTWPDHQSATSPGDLGYGITKREYDSLNRLLRTSDQLGDTITHDYDTAGRLISRDYRERVNSPSGPVTSSDTFTYDPTGKMLTAICGQFSNTVAFSYDDAGRKLTESLTISGQTYTVTSEYDAAGRVAKLIFPDTSEVVRSYTARGELSTISMGGTPFDTRVYDAGGRMVSSSYANGVSATRSYNNDNTLSGIAFSGAAMGNLAYSWDAIETGRRRRLAG